MAEGDNIISKATDSTQQQDDRSTGFRLFGFKLVREKKEAGPDKAPTFALPQQDDGAVVIQSGAYYGTYVDLEGVVRNEIELITRYREMAMQPELESAIDDIINEAVIIDNQNEKSVKLRLDSIEEKDTIKKRIQEEFETVLRLLNWGNQGHDIFRRWYIDGRIFYHLIINNDNPNNGIQELRYIDPRRIRKIREIVKGRDTKTGTELIKSQQEYYLYNERGIIGAVSNLGARISTDSVVNINSGLMDSRRAMVLSYLHKAIKPLNMLRMVEDATVIYRISRAPERRIFYIDVGNLPKIKAEQYLRDIMVKYRNKLVYDSGTGELRDDRKYLSMLEDFWLPRREGCFPLNTKIDLLDGRAETLENLIKEYKSGKQNWVYSVSPEGKIVPGKISWAGITRKNHPLVRITLDNKETIDATPDHKFILRDGTKVEAKDLKPDDSLMPFYSRKHKMGAKYSGEYHQVFDNEKQKWVYTHRVVSEYMNRQKKKNEVIHHKDFGRYNNNPDNLQIMDKLNHYKLHSLLGTNSWKNRNTEEHKKNLSTSGKAFFQTEKGKEVRKAISLHNKTNPIKIEAWKNAKTLIKEHRKQDKLILSKEKYLKKWSPGLVKLQEINKRIITEQNDFFIERFQDVCGEIDKIFYKQIKIKEIVSHLRQIYPIIKGRGTLEKLFQNNFYKGISDYLIVSYGKQYKWRSGENYNHKVISVTPLDFTADVGTLTVDGDNEYHNYHNFALSVGVFVMNSKGTEIQTLSGGQNLGELEDVKYFEKKLFGALGIPLSRLEPAQPFSLGRASEISRDEVKFAKLIARLRNRFAQLFDDLLRVQLVLKKVCTLEEWEKYKENILYDWQKDNNYNELKEADILLSRLQTAQAVDPYIGIYYSRDWVRKHVLYQTDKDIESLDKQIEEEKKEIGDDLTVQGAVAQNMANTQASMMGGEMGADGMGGLGGPGGGPGGGATGAGNAANPQGMGARDPYMKLKQKNQNDLNYNMRNLRKEEAEINGNGNNKDTIKRIVREKRQTL